jgi:hypothetical protein
MPRAEARDPVCGSIPCTLFATPAEAFASVLALKPSVLALGETHAQKEAAHVPSAAQHMTKEFLPLLAGVASDLVLEIWVANSDCTANQKKQIQQVATAQREVTKTQAPQNQTNFVNLFMAARKTGVTPHFLKPSCETYGEILGAGAGDIDFMLRMIARLSREGIAAYAKDNTKLVVAYGGSMHNDAEPRAGREAWAYGPAVKASTARYVEVDLVVPEFISDSEAWRAQRWYPHYTAGAQGTKTVLYTVSESSFALLFPPSPAAPL